jgi:hypothetical protein
MQTGSSTFSNPSAYGLGMQNTGQPLSQIMTGQPQFQNGARGPVAPVPSNEGLLNPMAPQRTGMFVPTRGSPMGAGSPQGIMPQQTGYQGMMMQPTGYAQGFQQGYGGQPQQMQQSEQNTEKRKPLLIRFQTILASRVECSSLSRHSTPLRTSDRRLRLGRTETSLPQATSLRR